jgi:Mrp family chromosome partitioning ATPase
VDILLLLTALRRRWRVIVALTVLGLLVGFAAGSSASGPETATDQPFVATHTLAVVEPPGSSQQQREGTQAPGPQLNTVGILLAGGDVAQRAAELLGVGDDPGALASQVRSAVDSELGTLNIIATDADPARAEAIADAFAAALLERLTTGAVAQTEVQEAAIAQILDGLQVEIDRLSLEAGAVPTRVEQAQLDALLNRYRTAFDQLQTIRTAPPASGFIDLAGASAARTTAAADDVFSAPTSRTGRAAIGGLVGLLVGAVLAVAIDRFDNRIRTVEAAEAALGMPVIVSVPPLPRRFRGGRAALPAPGAATDFDEALRLLRAALMLAGGRLLLRGEADSAGPPPGAWTDPKLRTLLVTSANPSEGKSTLIAGLGRAMGSAPSRVIVVDLDLRRPAQHRLFGKPAGPGVADLFATVTSTAVGAPPRAVRRTTAPPVRSSVLPAAPAGSTVAPSVPPASPDAPAVAGPATPPETHGGDTGPRGLDDILVEVVPGVRLAPAGTASAPPALLSAGARLVAEARTRSDIVLIDAPPLLAVSEPSELLPSVDGVLVAIFAGRTTMGDAMAVSERLDLLGASVVGAVLVGAPPSSRSRRTARRYAALPARPASDVTSASASASPSANGSAPPVKVDEPAEARGG